MFTETFFFFPKIPCSKQNSHPMVVFTINCLPLGNIKKLSVEVGADRLPLLMAEGRSWLTSGPRIRAPWSPLTLPAMLASALWTLPSYLQQDVSETKPTFVKGQLFKKSRESQWKWQEKDKQLENICLECLRRLALWGRWPRGLIAKIRQSSCPLFRRLRHAGDS